MYSWLEEPLQVFRTMKQANRLPHGILISAPLGIGGNDLAIEIAREYLCEKGGEIGCKCHSCMMFENKNHQDFYLVENKKYTIGIDEMREGTSSLELTALNGNGKVLLVTDAETMTEQSSNALLKTLEEPPKGALIILSTSRACALLPTILSRTMKLQVILPSFDKLNAELQKELQTNKNFDLELLVCGYSLDKVKEIVADDLPVKIEEAINLLVESILRRVSPLKFVNYFLNEIKDDELRFGILYNFIREAMRCAYNSDNESFVMLKSYDELRAKLATIDPDSLAQAHSRILTLKNLPLSKIMPINNLQLLSWVEIIASV